jgi:glyoxylase-like metal-dependent hydrolase (beta-lactamase superfamily II)
VELLPNIHLIEGVTSNAYLIVEPEGLSVIDTGLPGSGDKIVRYLRRIGQEAGAVRRILLTHQHADHVGGAARLAALSGAQVIAHPLDAPAIEGAAPRELPHGVLRLVFQVAIVPRLATVAVAQQVRGGETLPVLASEGGLQVIEAPGHTLGQIIFYQPGRKLLFAGDAYNHQGGRILPPAAIFNHDDAQAKRTLAELARTLEVDASLPGHGRPIARGAGAALAEAGKRLGG